MNQELIKLNKLLKLLNLKCDEAFKLRVQFQDLDDYLFKNDEISKFG